MLDYDLPQTRLADVSLIVRVWMRKLTQGKIKSHFRCLKHLFLFVWAASLSALHTHKGNQGTEPLCGGGGRGRFQYCTTYMLPVLWFEAEISVALYLCAHPPPQGLYSMTWRCWKVILLTVLVERAVNAQNLNLLEPLKREQICATLWHSCLSLNSHVM